MNVLLIDDHPLYRVGLKALLTGLAPGSVVVGVSRVADAPAAVAGRSMDLVLLDMNPPGSQHLMALDETRALFEGVTVVVVSGEEDVALMLAAVDAGASGYMPKSFDPELTIQALRVVLAQGVYLPAAALRQAIKRNGHNPLPASAPAPAPAPCRSPARSSNRCCRGCCKARPTRSSRVSLTLPRARSRPTCPPCTARWA